MKESMIYILLLLLAVVLFILELFLGSVSIPFDKIFDILFHSDSVLLKESWKIIVLESRLPRALSASIAGALLALSGLFMQTLFKNPLAGPHILGVSAGSSLGVAVILLSIEGMTLGVGSQLGLGLDLLLVLASFLGAFAVLFLLFAISLRIRDVLTVLIFGVLIGAVSMALVGILQYLSDESQLKAFLIWTLGSFDGVEMHEALLMTWISIPLLLLTVLLLKPLNLLLLGEEYAASLGLKVKSTRLYIMLLAGAMTALVTAYCGPIGFVGVVVPHFSRMVFKTYDHKKLLISSVLIGINIMLFADVISHLPGNESILPVNSITSLIGIPFIFWMLLKRKTVSRL